MTASPPLSRRCWLGLLLQGLVWARPASPVLGIDRLAGERAAGVVTTHVRRYRIHATIRLLAVPLFSKDDVGGACAMFEETCSGPTRTTALQFSGGSWPDRLQGFNRYGMTQEAVRAEDGAVVESAYLSLITSSGEKNFEQARKAFDDRSSSLPIAVAHGTVRRSGYASALDWLTASSRYTWCDCPRLVAEIRARISPAADSGLAAARGCVSQPFLHAVRTAMLAGVESRQSVFVYNARLYRLRTRLAAARGLTMMTGWMAEQGSDHESEFRVWLDPSDVSALPVRIEFRPKSFLHLVFEHDPTARGPAFPSLMSKEQA